MKRSWIKRGTKGFKAPKKALKRGTLKKQGKTPISKIQRDLWVLCRTITRARYGNTCYTCGKTGLIGGNWQTGHMWAKASVGACLKYDLRILRPQCYFCNINLGGRGADFYVKMLKEVGAVAISQLNFDRQQTVKAYDHYLKLLREYQIIVDGLPTDKEVVQ